MFSINKKCLNDSENIYDPVDPNFYYYKGLDKLENNFDNILKSNTIIDNYYICGYRVNNDNLYPFLNTGITNYTTRQVQMINKRINKLTISMYSDITNKFLYQNNDTKWYIDLLVKGII